MLPSFRSFTSCTQRLVACNRYVLPSANRLQTAGRTLEDLDRYFAGRPGILVFRDKEATSEKRPEAFVEHEAAEVRRHSSVRSVDVSEAARRHLADTLDKANSGDADYEKSEPNRFEKEEV